jgi:hypothetical protein
VETCGERTRKEFGDWVWWIVGGGDRLVVIEACDGMKVSLVFES